MCIEPDDFYPDSVKHATETKLPQNPNKIATMGLVTKNLDNEMHILTLNQYIWWLVQTCASLIKHNIEKKLFLEIFVP